MQIEIKEYVNDDGSHTYVYHMYDGPDGIDDTTGEFSSLGQCFEQIIKDRQLTSLSYRED